MRTLNGNLEQARAVVVWFSDNVARNCKNGTQPSYGSWFNNIVRWDAWDLTWYVEFKPKHEKINISCNDPNAELMATLTL